MQILFNIKYQNYIGTNYFLYWEFILRAHPQQKRQQTL